MESNLRTKLQDLIEHRGTDILEDIFYELREDEEIKFERALAIDIEKSAVAKKLNLRVNVALQLPERRRNTEIQTYNVDFLVEQEHATKIFKETMANEKA